ncbi:hypothetical protein [Ammoniphilus sp. 3BR4]|uniref:hypothetical protein n=1 Tax=Ammoniphilus sp. 3BR4 TaxID=3158265 RepID=UPI0034665C8D
MPNGKKIVIAQVGGPTAVINSSLYGFLKGFSQYDHVQDAYHLTEGLYLKL